MVVDAPHVDVWSWHVINVMCDRFHGTIGVSPLSYQGMGFFNDVDGACAECHAQTSHYHVDSVPLIFTSTRLTESRNG